MFEELKRLGEYRQFGDKEQVIIDCPFCGKKSTPNNVHSSFGNIFPDGGYGFHCFVCGHTCSLKSLARAFDIDIDQKETLPQKPKKVFKPKTLPNWFRHKERLLGQFTSHPQNSEVWQMYKPLTDDMIAKYHLGLGLLPATKDTQPRLITPIFNLNNELSLFRGRAIFDEQIKWLPSGGISPYDIDLPFANFAKKSNYVFVVENYVDAILINEYSPYTGVCTLSTTYWCDKWAGQLYNLHPKWVIIAYDSDLAGNGGNTREQTKTLLEGRLSTLEKEPVTINWFKQTKMHYIISYNTTLETDKRKRIILPNGIRLKHKLKREGFDLVDLARWPKLKMDIGDLLNEYRKKPVSGEML